MLCGINFKEKRNSDRKDKEKEKRIERRRACCIRGKRGLER
jgi:hypothetical protein